MKNITPRAAFLESHPEARALQTAALAAIAEAMTGITDKFGQTIKDFVASNGRELWEAGVKIADFIETLPGRELSVDFYEQLRAEFVDQRGRPIRHDILVWLASIARKYPDGKIETFKVIEMWRDMVFYFAEEKNLKLLTDKPREPVRSPSNPYLDVFAVIHTKAAHEHRELDEAVKAFRENPQFGDFHTLKERRLDLYQELRANFQTALSHRNADAEQLEKLLKEMD